MSVYSTTVRHDGLSLLRERGTWLLLAVLTVASLAAVSSGQRELSRAKAIQDAVELQNEKARDETAAIANHLAQTGATVPHYRDPGLAEVVGRRLIVEQAMLPPNALFALSAGQTGVRPLQQPVSLESREVLLSEGELTPPRMLAVGAFDLDFIIVFLAPLTLIVLGYGVPAWERQQGLLALHLLPETTLTQWIATRHGLRLLAVIGILSVIGAFAVATNGASVADAVRFFAYLLIAVLYLAFWSVVIVAVSTRTGTADKSLLILATIWLALVMVLPSAINAAALIRFPAPQRIDYVDAFREATDQARARASEILTEYLEDHPEMAAGDVDPQDYSAQRYAVRRKVEEAMSGISSDFEARREARRNSLQWLRLLSPAILAVEGLEEAAGTGDGRYAHFNRQAGQFHEQWRRFFEPHILSKTRFAAHADIPRFVYREEALADLAYRLAPIYLALTLMLLGAMVFAKRGLRFLQ